MCTGDTTVWLFIAVLSLLKHFLKFIYFYFGNSEEIVFSEQEIKALSCTKSSMFSALHLVLRDFILFYFLQPAAQS